MNKIGYKGSAQDLRNEDEAYIGRIIEMLQMEKEQANDFELAALRNALQKAVKSYRKEISN
jgi:hypothetical protein